MPGRTFEQTIKRYHNTAVNLIEGRGYSHFNSPPYQPTFLKPPTYAFFLAGIYKTFGINFMVVRIIQALLDVLGCWVLFLLTRQYFSEKAAFLTMLLICFYPITAVYANLLNPESLTMFLMIVSLFFVSKSIQSNNVAYFFAAGLSTILMGYCRPEFFIFIFVFALIVYFIKKNFKLKFLLYYFIGLMVIMGPWVGRNYLLTKRFIPLSRGDAIGRSIYLATLGTEIESQEAYDKFLDRNPKVKQLNIERYSLLYDSSADSKDIARYEKTFLQMGIERILNNPGGYILNRLRSIPLVWINLHADEFTFLNSQKLRTLHPDFQKIFLYLKEDPREVLILAVKYIFLLIIILYLMLAAAGLWQTRKRFTELAFIIVPLIYAQIFFLLMFGSPNYTIPYWPCVIFFSGIGFNYFLERHKFKKAVLT
jgi:4-amino-4-deoxy-L-arabinose transferase-like glycosyltransferase